MKIHKRSHPLLCVQELEINNKFTIADSSLMNQLVELAKEHGTYEFNGHEGVGYIPDDVADDFIYTELLLAQIN
jgi:hypothetical protein